MDRETWFKLLQIAVVAPYIYSISEKQTGYFKIGLKLVAGSLVIMNLPPLIAKVQPLIEMAQQMQEAKDAQVTTGETVEGEITT